MVRRLRPRSVRGRLTALTLAVLLVIWPIVIVAVALITRGVISEEVEREVSAAARQTGSIADRRRFRDDIPARGSVDLIQIVGVDGRVLAATVRLRGRPPITAIQPERGDFGVGEVVCTEGRCFQFIGYRLTGTAYGDIMIYAGKQRPQVLDRHWLEVVLVGVAVLFSAGVVAGVWRIVGSALKPVARIQGQLAELTASDLGGRMPVPETGDEIERLAETVNETLARLDLSLGRQRQFVSDASHELRTPITGLRARLESELAAPGSRTELVETLTAALGDTERLQAIVTDLLQLARVDSGRVMPRVELDLAELVAVEAEARPWRLEVGTDLRESAVVSGNRLQLARLLANLIVNADRYAESRVLLVVRTDGPWGIVEVHDDGPGIAPADRERVFERFTRLDAARARDKGGTGLGLAIARDIAGAHGGTVTIGDSPLLGGAVMIVKLPLLGPENEDPRDPAGPGDLRAA
ncbi:sensor histidine kinase [Actinocorallia lasiicapitis]